MPNVVTIHQPEYLPWLGFFDRICQSDVLVFLDDVGYQKNGFINRNKIKTAKGEQWITIPVKGRSPHLKINQVLIDTQTDWKQRQLGALIAHYSRAPYFKEYFPIFEDAFKKPWEKIADLDMYLIEKVIAILGLKTRTVKSSELNVEELKTERLVSICKLLKADTYLSGPGGKGYMDLELFKKAGIEVVFQHFTHPVYPQQYTEKSFFGNLSILDLLFNCGPNSVNIIKQTS